MDTKAYKTMTNSSILPKTAWTPLTEYSKVANGKIFKKEIITKHKIRIKFFPNCVAWSKVLGTELLDKDVLIGMDVYCQADRLKIMPRGLQYKREFMP